jgi:hypothetical protein
MNLERPLAILFWMIMSFLFGGYCFLHPVQSFHWLGGAGDYVASLINRDCKPTPGYRCVPITSPSPNQQP